MSRITLIAKKDAQLDGTKPNVVFAGLVAIGTFQIAGNAGQEVLEFGVMIVHSIWLRQSVARLLY